MYIGAYSNDFDKAIQVIEWTQSYRRNDIIKLCGVLRKDSLVDSAGNDMNERPFFQN